MTEKSEKEGPDLVKQNVDNREEKTIVDTFLCQRTNGKSVSHGQPTFLVSEENERLMMERKKEMADEEGDKSDCSCWKSKYNWRTLLPFACCCKSPTLTNVENSGFLELFSISWASDLIVSGFKKTLTLADLNRLARSETSSFNYEKFLRHYNEEKERSKGGDVSIGRVILRLIRTKYLFAIFYLLITLILQLFTAGYIFKKFLSFIEKPTGSVWIGIQWTGLLILAQFVTSLLSSGLFMSMLRAGIAARSAVLSLIYHKLSKLKNTGNKSVGELVNLCANDAQRVFECCQFGVFIIGAPVLLVLISAYLYWMFGPSSLIGVVVMILFLPLQALLGKIISKIRYKVIQISDKRVKMISEVLTCIKLIKMYAWEKSFLKEIHELRRKEKKHLAVVLYLMAINMSMAVLLTAVAPVATFAAHIAFGNDLSVAEAFTVITMFNIFPRNIALLPIAVRGLSESMNAMNRLKSLLKLEEYVPHAEEPNDPNVALEMISCDFSWPVPLAEVSPSSEKSKNEEEKTTATYKKKAEEHEASVVIENPAVKIESGKKAAEDNTDEQAKQLDATLSPTLFDIDISVKKGSLIGICGSVGSGKSSMIQAILAQMHCTTGKVKVIKSVAYVSQQAWIMHDTIRNNITLGKEYKEEEYKEACKACSLNKDLESFESGDLSEIGERGINLSGGQKQRISLARALYADADLYLLDDPLSAVDAHVGQHIFKHCIKEKLHDKTVIFVTHQLQYLKYCDQVICMSDGRIEEYGTFTELTEADKEFSRLITKFYQEHENLKQSLEEKQTIQGVSDEDEDEAAANLENGLHLRERQTSKSSSVHSDVNLDNLVEVELNEAEKEAKQIEKGKIVKAEESSTGSVGLSVYKKFAKAGGGCLAVFAALFGYLMVLGVVFFIEWWLSRWLEISSKPVLVGNSTIPERVSFADNPDLSFFMTVYVSVGCSMFFFQFLASSFCVVFFVTASTNLHNTALNCILKCPMKFFDSTPSGRILNRFSRDIDELDGRLPWTAERLFAHGSRIFLALIFMCVIFPWFLLAIVPTAILFVVLNKVFRRTSRELKRLDNVTRSPMFSHLATTVQGLTTLHAYRKSEDFKRQFDGMVDHNSTPMFLYHTANRWFQVRLDILCITLTLIVAIIAIFTRGSVPAAFAGLAVVYSMKMTGLFQFTCRLFAETEARFTSVERLISYGSGLELEGNDHAEEEVSPQWPKAGQITFENVKLRYRPNMPLVLKDVSFSLNSKEKIGIAGRTGAGKSSLAVALFRLAELDEGRIVIDDKDISKIDLADLRSRLAVIPQDPVLFIGTLRYNLDPFGRHTDEALWSAIDKAHMRNTVTNLPLKLETAVVENGENFSVGERQLICMARALLRESKILMLDEATAAIDTETDLKIQETIRDSFKDCTVLTIAHRLNTILECDRILVMDDGKVAEFDSPSNLMSNPDSIFASMLRKSDITKD